MQEPEEQTDQDFRSLDRAQRSLLRRLVEVLRFLDLMTLLMVAATVLSAIATWRSSQIAHQILRSAYRPYVGVREMKLDLSNPTKPQVRIEILNFGTIPAEKMVLSVSKTVDGKPVPDFEGVPEVVVPVGVLTPSAPDDFGSLLPIHYLQPVVDGKSQLSVRVRTTYNDAANNHYCYDETFGYFAPTARFSPAHGSDECF